MFPWCEDAPTPYTHQEHEREMVAFILLLYINLSLSRDVEFQHPVLGPHVILVTWVVTRK